MTTEVTIEGKPALAASAQVWGLQSGTRPFTSEFDMAPVHAEQLFRQQGQRPVKLVFDARGERRKEFKNLYIINVQPGPAPALVRLTLADRRIWWSYPFIIRSFNIRRVIGYKRLKTPAPPGGDLPQLNPVDANIWYAKYSLATHEKPQNTQPVLAVEALRDVLTEVLLAETQTSGEFAGLTIRASIGQLLNPLPLEEVEIRGNGDVAIEQALAFLPEAKIFVDADGQVIVTSKVTGEETALADDSVSGPPIVGGGTARLVENKNIRPRAVHVYFVRQIEFRSDFIEPDSKSSTGLQQDEKSFFMENVLPLPDFSNTIGGKELCQGTWITLNEALTTWGNDPLTLRGRLDYKDLLYFFTPFMNAWGPLQMLGQATPEADWASRIAAIQSHWRTTFRLNPNVMDRIRHLKAERVAVIHQAKGRTAPAICYSNYAVIPNARAWWREFRDKNKGDASWATNVRAYPNNSDGPGRIGLLDTTTKPASARVEILDHDQGIVHINYITDPLRLVEMTIPSMIELEGNPVDTQGFPIVPGPTANITDRNRPICFDAISKVHRRPRCTPQFKAAVIMSAIPASPNDKRQLHRIVITPLQIKAKKILPPWAESSLENAGGPVLEVFVGPERQVARIAYTDQNATETQKALGLIPGEPNFGKFCINQDSGGGGERGASLNAIATAVAAAIYAGLTDRVEGEKAVGFNPGLLPVGWLDEVVHEVGQKGEVITRMTFPHQSPQFDLASWLNSADRAAMLHLAGPGR